MTDWNALYRDLKAFAYETGEDDEFPLSNFHDREWVVPLHRIREMLRIYKKKEGQP